MTIGERIQNARKRTGLTQEELGERVGVTGVAIMRYEKGARQPRLEQLQAIAQALGVSVLDLLGANTPEAQQLMERDSQRTGRSLVEIEGEAVRDILDEQAANRLIAALEAADPAVIQAFAEIPDSDITTHLHTIVDEELTRDGRILTLKRAYELAKMTGYGRFVPSSAPSPAPEGRDTTQPQEGMEGPPEGQE